MMVGKALIFNLVYAPLDAFNVAVSIHRQVLTSWQRQQNIPLGCFHT